MSDPVIKFQPRDNPGEYKNISSLKSSAVPPRKPFKDLMDKGESEDEHEQMSLKRKGFLDETDDVSLLEEGKVQKSDTPSLFDLQKLSKEVVKEAPPLAAQTPPKTTKGPAEETAHAEEAPESPANLFKRMSGSKEGAKTGKTSVGEHDLGESERQNIKEEKFVAPFHKDQPLDLSYINPLNAAAQPIQQTAEVKSEQPIAPPRSIQLIVDQIVKSMETQKTLGKMDTIITLKHPPLFENVNVVVTTYDTARGQFNLSFENLTQAAKNMLDMQANQDSLKHALEIKGYAVHIVTTTTNIETPVIADASADKRERNPEDNPEDREQKRQQR